MVVLFTTYKHDYPFASTLKWVISEHMDFSYDYETNTILTNGYQEVVIDEFMDLADNLEQSKTITIPL